MVYSEEQILEVKKQILEQTKNLPVGQRAEIEEQIDAMSAEELEIFVQQQMAGKETRQESQKGIFRMIADGDVPSKKIAENKEAVAVVSVKAVSRAHVLIIPKKPAGDANSIPASVYNLARVVAKKIVSKFDAKSTAIQTENAFGEVVVNVIPIYDKPLGITSPRYDVGEKELEEVYLKLRIVKKPKIERIKKTVKKEAEVLKLRRRVP